MTQVFILSDEAAARILFSEMVRVAPINCILGNSIDDKFNLERLSPEESLARRELQPESRGGPAVEVHMTINGVEVDAIRALSEAWRRAAEHIDNEAAKKALRMVSDAGLSDLEELLSRARYEIRDKLQKKFPDVDFSSDY